MLKHTNEKWYAVPTDQAEGYDCFWIQTEDGFVIATAEGSQLDEARKANANLLAAAPDMLNALETALDALHFLDSNLEGVHSQIKTAINKAKGYGNETTN